MYILIPSYVTPYQAAPLPGAVGTVTYIACEIAAGGSGRCVLTVAADAEAAAAGRKPVGDFTLELGVAYPTGEADEAGRPVMAAMPTFAQMMADNQEAFDTIRAYLYAHALRGGAVPGREAGPLT